MGISCHRSPTKTAVTVEHEDPAEALAPLSKGTLSENHYKCSQQMQNGSRTWQEAKF